MAKVQRQFSLQAEELLSMLNCCVASELPGERQNYNPLAFCCTHGGHHADNCVGFCVPVLQKLQEG